MPNITGATQFFPKAAENTVAMTLGGSVTGGSSTTVPVNNMSNYTDGDTVVFVVDPSSSTAKQVFTGQKSGTNVVNVIWTEGTNQAHSTGAVVVDYVTATHWDLFQKGITVAHNQNGTLVNASVPTAALVDGSVTTAKLAASAVTSAQLAVTVTTDANGWTVRDFGTYKRYEKTVQIATGGGSVASGSQASYNVTDRPVGFTTSTLSMMTSNNQWSAAMSNDAPFFLPAFEADSTLYMRNISGAGANLPNTIYLHVAFTV